MLRLGVQAGGGTSLAVRLTWLTGLRLLFLTIFLIVTAAVYLGGFTPGRFSSIVALITIAGAYLAAFVYALLLRRGRALKWVARAQLVTDQITWTAIVYITGGVTSGATSLYGLTCLTGAVLLGWPGALMAAVTGATTYTLLCVLLVLSIVPVPQDQPLEVYVTRPEDLSYPIFVNLLAILVVTLLASYLAERLRWTGGKLVQATARAEQAERLAVLGRLAAGLAHEIRNPLGSIAGSIELLRTGNNLDAEDRKLCEIIARETSRLNDLVGDMLELSRPRAPAIAQIDLAAIVRDVVTLAGKSGRGTDVLVRLEEPGRAEVSADAAQMRQVVWNLLRNAIQASSAGATVVVRLFHEPTGNGEGTYTLEVRDQGPGIPADARERLFDAFYTTRSQGVGIGLAVVKRIVEDHGFTIEVESQQGKGATFRVRMPMTMKRRQELESESSIPPPASETLPRARVR